MAPALLHEVAATVDAAAAHFGATPARRAAQSACGTCGATHDRRVVAQEQRPADHETVLVGEPGGPSLRNDASCCARATWPAATVSSA